MGLQQEKKKGGLKEWPLDREHRHPKWVRPYRSRWTQGEPRCHKSTRLSTRGCHCWGSPIPQRRATNQRRCESCSAPATKSDEAKREEHRWPETVTSEHPTRTRIQDPKRRAVLTVVCAWMESSETWVQALIDLGREQGTLIWGMRNWELGIEGKRGLWTLYY